MIHLMDRKTIILISVFCCVSSISFFFLFKNNNFHLNHYRVEKSDNYYFPYDLNEPHKTFKLPEYLTEISGLSYYKKNKIICVQDEKAKLVVYD